jgi:hypothetical protein
MSKNRQREESARALARLDKKQGIKRHGSGRWWRAYSAEYYCGYNSHTRHIIEWIRGWLGK